MLAKNGGWALGWFLAFASGVIAAPLGVADGKLDGVEAKIRELDHAEPARRIDLLHALANQYFHTSITTSAMIRSLRDDHPEVRVAAAAGLGSLHFFLPCNASHTLSTNPKRHGPLTMERCGYDPTQVSAAAAALDRALADSDERVREAAAAALAAFGPDAKVAIPNLVQAVSKGSLTSQRNACRTLRRIGPEARAALPALKARLRDHDATLREEAITAVAAVDSANAALDALEPLLRDGNTKVRLACADEVLKITSGHELALGALRELASHSDARIRELVVRVASRSPDANLPLLLDRLGAEPDAKVRTAVLTTLRFTQREREKVFLALLAVVRNPREAAQVQAEALIGLGTFGPAAAPAIPDLIRALKRSQSDECRHRAAGALAAIGPTAKASVPALIMSLGHKKLLVRLACIRALHAVGATATDAVPALLWVAERDEPFVVLAVFHEIQKYGRQARIGLPQLQELADTHEVPHIRLIAASLIDYLKQPET